MFTRSKPGQLRTLQSVGVCLVSSAHTEKRSTRESSGNFLSNAAAKVPFQHFLYFFDTLIKKKKTRPYFAVSCDTAN